MVVVTEKEGGLVFHRFVAFLFIAFGVLLLGAVVSGISFRAPARQNSGPLLVEVPQNRTVVVWPLSMTPGLLNISWSAPSGIQVFVLNANQMMLLVQRSGYLNSSTLSSPVSFAGEPNDYLNRSAGASGQSLVFLSGGEYTVLAYSPSQSVVGQFAISAPSFPVNIPRSSYFVAYAYAIGDSVIGAAFIVLGTLILTKQVWK